jgi:hypothetical protein
MYSNPVPKDETIIIDPANVPLDAVWEQTPCVWTRLALWIVARSRYQAAIFAYAAIIGVLLGTGVRADHTAILSIALTLIAIVAVSTEWIGSRYYGHRREEREAAPRYASKDQAVA